MRLPGLGQCPHCKEKEALKKTQAQTLVGVGLKLVRFLSWPSQVLSIQEEGADYTCDVVIYNKNYVFGLRPVPGTEFLTPWEFPNIIRPVVFGLLSLASEIAPEP